MRSTPVRHGAPQVEDDLALLDLMMEDLRAAPPLFQPTAYWQRYERDFLPEIRERGLHDFRRRENSVLSSFGATDLLPEVGVGLPAGSIVAKLAERVAQRVPALWQWLHHWVAFATRGLALRHPYDTDTRTLRELAHAFVVLHGAHAGARPLADAEASPIGNPADLFEVGGRRYTMSFLYYYMRYAYVQARIDLDALRSVVELGSGAGKRVEVLKQLHPRLGFLLFDIPPQLYIAEQYLKARFPGDVVSYRETRDLEKIDPVVPGKILLFACHQLPLLEGSAFDLFWNAASFQDMEPEVVANYLAPVNRGARFVYLMELFAGKQRLGRDEGAGVREPTTWPLYENSLSSFQCIDRREAWRPLSVVREPDWDGVETALEDTFWCRPDEPRSPVALRSSASPFRR